MAMLLDGYTWRQKDMVKGAKTAAILQGGVVIWVCESTASAVDQKRAMRAAVESLWPSSVVGETNPQRSHLRSPMSY